MRLSLSHSIRPRTDRPRTLGVLASWLVFLGLLSSATPSRGADDIPQPEKGSAAAATLALIEHQRDICDTIAGRVLSYWTTLADQPAESQQAKVREQVLERQLSDLAASRTTNDLVDRLMPVASGENNDETVGSLRRLASVAKEICDTVALPTAPQQSFADRITELLDRFEFERVELGRLLVVPDRVLTTALEPYLLYIQRSGVEAEGDYLAYLESNREKPKAPTMKDLMQTWHAQVYLPAVEPSKQALGTYLQARTTQNVGQIGTSCRVLAKEVIKLLHSDAAFRAPDERLTPLLRPIFVEMRSLATNCTAGRQKEVDKNFAAMQSKLQGAARFMARYELRP